MSATTSFLTEVKLAFWRHFTFSYPAFLRNYGIFVFPTGARL